jgi:predicted ribonuclease YlaK
MVLTKSDIIKELSFFNYKIEELNSLDENELSIIWNNHIEENSEEVEIKKIFTEEYEDHLLISTPDGFQSVGQRIIKEKKECYRLTTMNGFSIECSYDHLVETKNGWVYAKDIDADDIIITVLGESKLKNKILIGMHPVYDLEVLHENHRYWSNGISSHNTGKTYISCAMALDMIKKYPEKYKKIVLIKSVTTLQDEEIGFLKGTLEEKMEPFMYSFMTNFEKLIGRSTLAKIKSDGLIEIRPIAYLRGSNIDNTVTIIDEAQNISKKNIRTILTRIGRDAKMIFLGDTNQIDMKKPHESSLAYMIENFKDFEEVGFVQMTDADEARHPLIPKLEKRFTEIEEKLNSKK